MQQKHIKNRSSSLRRYAPASALDTFKSTFHRAAKFQIPLLLISSICALLTGYLTSQLLWVVGSIAMIIIIPFTIFGLMPLNHKLLDADSTDKNLPHMLGVWGEYQLVRTILANIAFIVYILAVVLKT